MFSEKFLSIINRSDIDPSFVKRMENYLIEKKSLNAVNKIRLNAALISRISGIDRDLDLFLFINHMINDGILQRKIIIRSARGPSIKEFDSYEDLPDEILDIHQDVTIDVTEDNIDVVYVVGSLENDK